MNSLGFVQETFYRDHWCVQFKGLVVKDLQADIYGGIPFMIDNDIIQRPAKHIITVLGKYTVMETNATIPATSTHSSAILTLARVQLKEKIIHPGQSVHIPVPASCPDETIFVEPRIENNVCDWPTPHIANVKDGNIDLRNETDEPIIIGKDIHVLGITACKEQNPLDIPHVKHTPVKIPTTDHILQVNKNINTSVLNDNQIKSIKDVHNKFNDVFNGQLSGGYNGAFGKHVVSLQWADESRPKTSKLYTPKWSSNRDILLQKKIDQLTELGVLADPYEFDIPIKCIHPCFLQKKARAAGKDMDECDVNDVRFLTAANMVNDKCRQVQTKIPDQNEIFQFLAKNPYVIYADLFESFFQNHLSKKDWGYMAINSPFKGLRVYTRSTQGLLNQDEELNQLLCKVLGDLILQGKCMKIADDLVIGGSTFDDAIKNWEAVLSKLSAANLKLSPGKVRIFPNQSIIFGWQVSNGTITPDPHRKLALSKSKHSDIETVSDLRSWMGTYKTFLIALPGLAKIMDPFDKIVAGIKDNKTKVMWTDDLIKLFYEANKHAAENTKYLSLPRPDEQLVLMPDATVRDPAVGFVLNVVRNGKMLPVIYYSYKLSDNQRNWFPCEREALGVAIAVKKCSHYMLESKKPILILTDSKPVVEAFHLIKKGKFSASSRMSAFLMSVNRYKTDIQHVSGKFKHNIGADFLSRNPAECSDQKCQLCVFIKETTDISLSSSNINNAMPLGTKSSWKELQDNDFACSETFKRLTSGQQPNKKGPFSNDIKRYYNAACAKDLLVVQETIPNTTQIIDRIVIPKDFVPAVIVHLHYSNNQHLSAYQLEKVFNRYYFGIHVKQVITETINNCMLCQANKTLPRTNPEYTSTSNPEHPGMIFNADVIRRHGQKIFVCTDIFSTYTTAKLILDEKADTLTNVLIESLTPIRNNGHVIVRTDSAPAFKSIAKHSALDKLQISIQPTDHSNKNSIATVDRVIKEIEQEIIKLAPHSTKIDNTILSMVIKNINAKIRNRGLSAHEILFCRENQSNANLKFSDEKLLSEQVEIKKKNNEYASNLISDKPRKDDGVKIGDIIGVKTEKNKFNVRDGYMVTNVDKNNLTINKLIRFHSQNARLQNQKRVVQAKDVFLIKQNYFPPTPEVNVQVKPKKTSTPIPLPINKWQPFGKVEFTDSDDEIDPSPEKIILDTPVNDTEQNGENSDNDDPHSNIESSDNSDPCYGFQPSETDMPLDRASSISQLINQLDQSFHEANVSQRLPSEISKTTVEWDNEFDMMNTLNISSDFDDDVFEHSLPPPLLRVQSVDNMILDSAANIDTNQCANFTGLFPLPQQPTKNKKRVSPPRQLLPYEREGRRVTRSMSASDIRRSQSQF